MFPEERHQLILRLLDRSGRVEVNDLSEKFGVSRPTIRADLEYLSQKGLLQRTHGGALMVRSSESEPSFDVRRRLAVDEKERIGLAASQLVSDGEAIILDASTTALALAVHLKKMKRLTVLTNSLSAALELMDAPEITLMMPGGFVRKDSVSLVGQDPLVGGLPQGFKDFLQPYHFSKVFLSARGFSMERGLTEMSNAEVNIKRAFMERSSQTVALIDSSKIGQSSIVTFASANQIHWLVTDASAPADELDHFRQQGIKVLLA